MIKSLRFLFASLLMLVCGNAMAEDIIWQEDFSSYKADDVPAGGDYQYVCVDGGSATKIYAEQLAGGTAPELLVGKTKSGKTGSFTATIPMNGKSGSMFLSFKANYDRLTIAVEGATLGDKQASGTTYTYPIEVAAGTSTITISFTNNNSSNVRLDDIKLYQGTAKKPAGLSWGKASTTVTFGGDYALIPTLQNSNNLAVTCTSSNDSVCTVTSAGVITVEGPGEATITASFDGNDEYEAQSVSIVITVKPAETPVDPNAKGGENNPYLLTDDEFFTFVQPLDTANNPKSAKIYVKGYITNIEQVDTAYGNANFKIAAIQGDYDANIKLYAFRCKYLENTKFKDVNKIKVDDEVVLYGQIQYYGTGESRQPQFVSGYIYSLNGKITEPKYTITITNTEHGSLTLDKYEAAAGEKVSVTGMSTDEGWEMNEPTITAENGTEVEIGGSDEEGHYLIMPASNVTIALNITQLFTITTVFDSTQGDVRGISFDSEKNPIYKGAGKNVKFTVTPKDGFEVNSVTAADSDSNPITVNIAQDKSYYEFEMPAKNVTITATFSPASGISTVSVANAENAVRYNLAGQKVDAGYKGLHIINGKKVVMK